MGFDSTVRCVIFQNNMCYVYQVNSRFFWIIKPLFCRQVLCITGRMIWVSEAIEIDGTSKKKIGREKNGSKYYTVKDIWLNKNSHTEEDNLNKIFVALDDVDIDHYKWDASINIMNSKSLKSIINCILCSK